MGKKEESVGGQVDYERINRRLALRNNQNVLVKRFMVAAAFFTLLMLLPFTGLEPFSQSWALSLVSLWLSVSSLVAAWMFRSRSKKLQTLIDGENLLAEWRLGSKEKKAYIDYLFRREIGKNLAILSVISLLSIVIFGIFILLINDGRLFMLSALACLLFFIAFFALAMPYYYRYSNRKGDGIVLIGAKYAYINGYFHNWDFPLSGLSRIKIIHKPFEGIDLTYYYTDRTLRHSEELMIPTVKELDSESLVAQMKRLNDKKQRRKRGVKK